MKKLLAEMTITLIFALPIYNWSVGQGVKTPPFHGGITGSNPVRSTNKSRSSSGFVISAIYC